MAAVARDMRGEAIYLYAFDVASEIVTGNIHEILANTPEPFDIRADHTIPKDVPLYRPLAIEHTPPLSLFAGRKVRILIHVYDIGVISIVMRVAFRVNGLQELLSFHQPRLDDGRTFAQVARNVCVDVCRGLSEVMIQPMPLRDPEAYTVFCLADIGSPGMVEQWCVDNRCSIAALLTENEPGILSDMQIMEVLRVQYAYSHTDRVIIDWDAALVVDRSGYMEDIIYILELANLQLEEYHGMDKKLDYYLNKAYEDIRQYRFQLFRAYPAILATLRILRVDVTRLNDEITNITKFLGDWYLARVYLGARERFHLGQWRASVEDRLQQLDRLYSVVQSEITNLRMLWLEALIVIFFAIDLAAIFYFKV